MPLALHPRARALTTVERITILAVALAVFVFVEGPVWRHLWEPDAAILWSYAVIPAGVVVAFLRRGRPRLVPFVVESVLLSIVKFGITAFVLVALWSFGTPPVPAARAGGLLAGLLGSKSTKNSSSGRERGRYGEAERLAAALMVTVGDGRFSSKVIVLVPGGDIALRATDGHLHAVQVLAADGSILRNVPVLAAGGARLLSFEEISGGVSLRCAVHTEERAELTREGRR